MLFYAVSAALPTDKDVVSRTLHITVDGTALPSGTFDATATDLGEVAANEGQVVVLVLVDPDEAGNTSAPAEVTFTAADTIPPSAPELGVKLVREE